MAAVVDRALMLRKSARWESATQMRDALGGGPALCLEQVTEAAKLARPATGGSMVTATLPAPVSRWNPRLAVGAALTLAFVSAAGFYAMRSAAGSPVAAATAETQSTSAPTSIDVPPPPPETPKVVEIAPTATHEAPR